MQHYDVKKLGFGFMRLPTLEDKTIDQAQVNAMVDRYLERGFSYFDTAYVYHSGKSEVALKHALVERYPRDRYLVADKIPVWDVADHAGYEEKYTEMLTRLGLQHVDFLLLHNLGRHNYAHVQQTGGFEYLQQVKAEGRAINVGFSFHDTADQLDKILTDHPEVDFVQLQINYADWEDATVQSRQCYETATRHGKKVIVMEPVKGGSLVNLPAGIKELYDALDASASPASWAIRFAASLENVFMVLSGMSNMDHVQDNTTYMANFVPLTEKETATVQAAADAFRAANPIPCTACRYCTDGCPMNIDIPALFAMYNNAHQFNSAGQAHMHYERMTLDHGKAQDCIACGQCEAHCPQHINIIESLKLVSEMLDK